MRTVTYSLGIVLAASLLSGVVFAAEPNMQEGMWEIKGNMKMEGLPFAVPSVPVAYTQCLTKKDMVPQQKNADTSCKFESQKIEGNTVSWTANCAGKDGSKTTSVGKMTYHGDSFEGTVANNITGAKGEKLQSTMHMAGKRTGACK